MARVTIEDCIDKVENRYELILLAAQRAKDIMNGAPALVPQNKEKVALVSLREIAEDKLDIESLRETIIRDHQKVQAFGQEDHWDGDDVMVQREDQHQTFGYVNTIDAEEDILDDLHEEQEENLHEAHSSSELITSMYATESYDDEEVFEEEGKE